MEKFPIQPNIYEIAKERHILRDDLAKLKDIDAPQEIIDMLQSELEEANKKAGEFSIKEAGGLSEAKKLYKESKEKAEMSAWIDEDAIEKEIGPDYKNISVSSDKLSKISDFELGKLREAKFDPIILKKYETISKKISQEKSTISENISKIEKENPLAARAYDLVLYKKGLHQEGHIAPTSSVKENLQEIGAKMISGKPMFLHGPTGTGKTSLARFAAKHFTSKDAEIVYCTPQTRESNIWGKTGIRPAEGEAGQKGAIQTVDIYGPLSKAIKEGKVVIFDEFTALTKEQMVFVKGIFNAKVGDTVNIVGNGQTKIAPGFQMIFTANLKSEKNPERQELPPEIAREFEQNNLKIEYTPKDEAYDIILARLMNNDGSIDMSYYDLNETLPKFCEALAEIQIAYTDKESDAISRLTGTKDASGKTPGLKKFVMTQGTIEAILDDWKTEKSLRQKNISFAEFLNLALKRGLTFEEYPEKDRILAAKILASKGFLRTLSPKDLNMPNDIFAVDAIRKLRGEEAIKEIREKSLNEKHLLLKELVEFDPFGKRQEGIAEKAKQFLPKTEKAEKIEGEISIAEAREIMGQDFLGPEAVKDAFGVELESIPPIQFTKEDIERAKELNQQLVLYVDKTKDGKPFTGKKLLDQTNNRTSDGRRLFYSIDWYKNEKFFIEEAPRAGWKLVSKEIIPNSTGKNYLEQTETIINYLKDEVFKDKLIPEIYQKAIDEFESQKSDIAKLINSDWRSAAGRLENLQVTNLTRESPIETIYQLALNEKTNKERLLNGKYNWTLRRDSDGKFVYVGYFDADGAYVGGSTLNNRNGGLGVSFSRSL